MSNKLLISVHQKSNFSIFEIIGKYATNGRQKNMEIKRMKAIVKWFDRDGCGYGFAFCLEIDEDVFIHTKEVPEDVNLKEGDIIFFDLREGSRGYRGKKIKVME